MATLEGEILRNQEGVLKVRVAQPGMTSYKNVHGLSQLFLEVLRGPARVDILARQRELRELEATAVHPPRGSTPDSPEAGPSTKVPPAVLKSDASPTPVTISKVALYVGDIEGFGEWEVFCTDHANKDLRKLRKESKDIFLMVMKKIRCVY